MLRLLDRLEEVLIATLMAIATTVIFVAVVQRYALGAASGALAYGRAHDMPTLMSVARDIYFFLRSFNMTWAQELCIYAFVWMAKFGAAYGVRTGIHVGVDVLLNKLPAHHKHRTILFGLGAGALFTGIVAAMGANFVWHIAHTDQTSADLEAPMWLVYLAIPLGSGLMCFRFLQVARSFAQTGELPVHDHAHVDGMDEAEPVTEGKR